MLIDSQLIEAVRSQHTLSLHGLHGLRHWGRVYEIGMRLAPANDADVRVVALFALFHDACRHNDGYDPQHGWRGARLAEQFYADGQLDIEREALNKLVEACENHTSGLHHKDPTIGTCWDSDRLDLPRCGGIVDRYYLSTAAARDIANIRWAHAKASIDRSPCDGGQMFLRSEGAGRAVRSTIG